MNYSYYIYLNCNGLTKEQLLEINKFARELRKSGFKGIEGNTIYVTWYNDKPFIYKVDKVDVEIDNPFELNIETSRDIPLYNITIIDEPVEM